jgi:hypothetical protein
VARRGSASMAQTTTAASGLMSCFIGASPLFDDRSRDVLEHVHRAAHALAGLDVRELFASQIHGHKRGQVEVGVNPDGLHLLFSD